MLEVYSRRQLMVPKCREIISLFLIIFTDYSTTSKYICEWHSWCKDKTKRISQELKAKQDKIVKLQTHDLSCYLSKIFLVIIVFKIGLFVKQHLMY